MHVAILCSGWLISPHRQHFNTCAGKKNWRRLERSHRYAQIFARVNYVSLWKYLHVARPEIEPVQFYPDALSSILSFDCFFSLFQPGLNQGGTEHGPTKLGNPFLASSRNLLSLIASCGGSIFALMSFFKTSMKPSLSPPIGELILIF